jgi:hypothetical protein
MVFDARALRRREPLIVRQLEKTRPIFDLFFVDQSVLYRQSTEVGLADISGARNFQSVFKEIPPTVAHLDFDPVSSQMIITVRGC